MPLRIWLWPGFLLNRKDIEGAFREINNALELKPGFWEARRFRGQIILKKGVTDDIVSDYARR